MRFLILIFLFSIDVLNFSIAQQFRKNLNIVGTENPPAIDGKLDDIAWKDAATATEFIQYLPYNAEASRKRTVVKVLYDSKALYFGAMMYDTYPDSISKTLSARDTGPDDNADIFAIVLGPYNDGTNTNMFFLSAAGVQSDMKTTSGGDDVNWDAIWQGKTNIVDSGWIAEIKIPFTELRYSKEENQIWAFNLFRKITTLNEWSSWSYVDNKIEGISNQNGTMSGLLDLHSLLRLSFIPYLSAFAEHDGENNLWTRGIRGGLDLRYGINESFTLDMMLIPDFSQVQTDDRILNLSPFEVKYEEHRPFFNEGAELFSKGELYYSKRVGGVPRFYWDVEDNLSASEIITKNPVEAQIINASKITGRTKNGLGIGFFNAMTLESKAKIKDTLSFAEREYQTQPFTNYNLIVLDQSLKNNSHFGIVNSNTAMPDIHYNANVSAIDFNFRNKAQSYQFRGIAGLSQIYEKDNSSEYGFSSDLNFEKTAGKFQFGLGSEIFDDRYNPNDLGYLSFNNYIETNVFIRYKLVQPTKTFIDYYSFTEFSLMNRFKPIDFMSFEMESETGFTFHNFWTTGFFFGFKPIPKNDFYEPRLDNRVYLEPADFHFGVFLISDSRKSLFFRLILMHWQSFSEYDQNMKRVEFSPNWRINDRFIVGIASEFDQINNSLGYVSDDADDVFFGKRTRKTVSNELNFQYGFNENMNLSLRARHYLSSANYNHYYLLNQDGTLSDYPNYPDNENVTFNAFNIDLVYTWRFAPGSDIIFVWKNAIYDEDDKILDSYMDNLDATLNSPQYNHFSIKFLYYLDYSYFVKKKPD